MARRPEVPDDELGDRLIAAAAEVFAERGFERAGVAEIARRAGVTTGAIYSRWSGKAELLVEAIDAHATAELEAVLGGARAESASDVLTALGTRLVERPAAGRLLLEAFAVAARDDEFAAMLRRRLDDQDARLAKIVEEGRADGTIDPSLDTDAVVTLAHAIGLGLQLHRVVGRPLPERAAWQALIARVVASGAPPGARPRTAAAQRATKKPAPRAKKGTTP